MSDDVQEMRAIFLEEMAELVQDLETDLLQLESSPGSGLIDRLFRNLHTIKGGAGMVGLGPLSHYTHAVETMLDEVRKGGLVLSSALISLLLEALDCLKMFMAEAHGEATLDLQAVENSHTRILAATGEDPPVAGWAAPTETGPVCLVAAPRRDTTTGDLNTFILQVSARPDFFPRPSELEAVTGRLQMLGDLLCISHEHSLPVEGKRQAEIAYLWRSFHLVTEADAAAVLAALGDWPQRHKTELHHLTFLPEAPENQAQIDAAVDGSSHDVLGDQQIVPLPSGTVIPLPSAPAAQEFPRAANNGKVDAPAVYRRSSIRVETAIRPLPGHLARVRSMQAEIRTLLTNDADISALNDFADKFAVWEKLADKAAVLAVKNTEQQAAALSAGEVRSNANKVVAVLQELTAATQKSMAEEKVVSGQNYAAARNFVIIFTVLSILVSFIGATYISLLISKNIDR